MDRSLGWSAGKFGSTLFVVLHSSTRAEAAKDGKNNVDLGEVRGQEGTYGDADAKSGNGIVLVLS